MLRAVFAAVVLVGLLLVAAPSARAGAAARLTYLRDSSAGRCPDEGALRRLIADRVGYDPFFPWARKAVVVEVTAGRSRGYQGAVKVVDEKGVLVGERQLTSHSDDCVDLARALALAVSIAVDEHALDDVSPVTQPEPPAGPPAPSDRAAEPPAPDSTDGSPEKPSETPAETPAKWQWSAHLMPSVAFEAAPSAAVGADGGVSTRFRRVAVAFDLRADLPASEVGPGGSRASIWLALASLASCLSPVRALFVCALGGGGIFVASGHDLATPRTESTPFFALGGRVALEVPVAGRLFVVTKIDALGALTRPSVSIDSTNVFRLPAVSWVMGAGVGLVL